MVQCEWFKAITVQYEEFWVNRRHNKEKHKLLVTESQGFEGGLSISKCGHAQHGVE